MIKNKFLLTLALLMLSCWVVSAQSLRVATYNLRYDSKDDSLKGDGWVKRRPVIAALVRFHDFDIFGIQEGLHHQLTSLNAGLPGYTWLGVGRDDGKEKGEYAAIFYKTDKYKVLQQGHFWLSTITDRPNTGWDAALPRICSWAQFEDKKTHFRFYFYNLHMDHIGVTARSESAKLILAKIKAMPHSEPVILTGDFNVDQTSPSYELLNTSGVLKDCYTLADHPYAPSGTFNDFNVRTNTPERIDHIFVTKQFKVERYGILTDSYNGRTPSDHYPVMVELKYGK